MSNLPATSRHIAHYLTVRKHLSEVPPTLLEITKATGMTDVTARNHLQRLEASGWVEMKKKGKVNSYLMTFPQADMFPGAKIPKADSDKDFDLFWAECPRKFNKPAARRAWDKIKKTPGIVANIMAALKRHKTLRTWTDRDFIPYPATMLNARFWEDELIDADFGTETSQERKEKEGMREALKRAQQRWRDDQKRLQEQF